MPEQSSKPLRIFWSYSHADEDLRDKLDEHLAALKRAKRVEVWHDRKIPAGSNWRSKIDSELESADIILLLVSAAFLHSEFCQSVELHRAIERHEAGEALVIPIMLRPCDVGGTPIERLQQLPEGGRPITKWGNRDEACGDVAKRLRIAVEEWTAASAKPSASIAVAPGPASAEARKELVLSRIFGLGQAVSLEWLRTLLERGTAVARIESTTGEPMGSGFLVDPAAFGLDQSHAPLLLSCSFVITEGTADPGRHGGLRFDEAVARFQIAGVSRGVKSVIWTSPVGELFSILVTLDGPVPGAQPLPIADKKWLATTHGAPLRVVVIAHPGGRDLAFSLQDTVLLDADEKRVHYRAATEGGSSGGVVLNGSDLTALAIHTSRKEHMPRLHGQPGFYEACEGISLLAIQDAVRNPHLPRTSGQPALE